MKKAITPMLLAAILLAQFVKSPDDGYAPHINPMKVKPAAAAMFHETPAVAVARVRLSDVLDTGHARNSGFYSYNAASYVDDKQRILKKALRK